MAQFNSEKKEFGNYLRYLRQKYELTISVLEAYADMDSGYISKLERGETTGRYPRIDIAHRLADAISNFCTPQEYWALLAKGGFLPIDWIEPHEIVALFFNQKISDSQAIEFTQRLKDLSLQILYKKEIHDDQPHRDTAPAKSMGNVQLSKEHRRVDSNSWNAGGARGIKPRLS